MQIDIEYSPAFALAKVGVTPGESVQAEAGAMVSYTAGIEMETSVKGGVMAGLKRSVLGGESFFMNTFTASAPAAEVTFAPSLPGDVIHWPLTNQTVYLQSGSFLAADSSIEVDTSWGGAKTFFSKEGLFLLKVTGTGDLLVSSYGAVDAIDLDPGQTYTVDTGHMVGWGEGVTYKVRKVGKLKETLLSGEGLVVELTGPGRIYLQTRSPDNFIEWLIPKLPTQRS